MLTRRHTATITEQ